MNTKPLPIVANRESIDGYVYCYDKKGRSCIDLSTRQAVVLNHDFRVYGEGLHRGAIGWTLPADSDGYSFCSIQFASGEVLRIRTYAFSVVEESESLRISAEIIAQNRNTRFDADSQVADRCRVTWTQEYFGTLFNLDNLAISGVGDQEVYAYTFPSLMELASLKSQPHYPVKLGYSGNLSEGSSLGRIQSQISEKAGFPEKPIVLLIFRTWDGRNVETQLHRKLKKIGRKLPQSPGKEWFTTNDSELKQLLLECETPEFSRHRILTGASESLREGFEEMAANGYQIQVGMGDESPAAFIKLIPPSQPDTGFDVREKQ